MAKTKGWHKREGDYHPDVRNFLEEIKENTGEIRESTSGLSQAISDLSTNISNLRDSVISGVASLSALIQRLITLTPIGYYEVSGRLTGNGILKASVGWYGGMTIRTNGINDATVVLYDSPSAMSGKRISAITVSGPDEYGGEREPLPVRFHAGCYYSVTGAGASCNIRYR